MKILITGAAGYIGEFVLHEVLKRGHQVIALVRSSPPTRWEGIRNLEALQRDLRHTGPMDLTDRGIDVIVHLAAATRGSAAEQFQDTVTGTVALLTAARQAGIRRLVGVSSVAVLDYVSLPPMTLIDESVATSNIDQGMGLYAGLKLEQESLFVHFGSESGHCCSILRPGLAYDESRLSASHAGINTHPIFLRVAHDGEVPTIEVRGLANAIANAAERNRHGCEFVHLMDDHLPSQQQYVAGLRRRGLLPHARFVLPWSTVSSILGFIRIMLSVTGLGVQWPEVLLPHGFSARLKPFRFSNARAKALLGWTPGNKFA